MGGRWAVNVVRSIISGQGDSATTYQEFDCGKCEIIFFSAEEFEQHKCRKGREKRVKIGKIVKTAKIDSFDPDQVEPDQPALDNELQERKLLVCHECHVPTKSYKDLMMHIRGVHDRNGNAICCYQEYVQEDLLEHMRYHLNDETYKCNGCERVFASAGRVRLHRAACYSWNKTRQFSNIEELEEEMRRRNLLVCPICTKSAAAEESPSLQHLMDHMKEEHTETGYIFCCNTKFDCLTIFQHIQFHLDEDLHKCDTCGRRFASKIGLDKHNRKNHTQSEQTLYECETCGKQVKSSATLVQHKKTHLAQRELTFFCEVCGRGFDIKSQLTSHTYTHREKRTEQCTFCGKHYFDVKTHISLQHSYKTKEICEICGTETKHLKTHMKLVHVDPTFNCTYGECGKVFRSARYLKEHLRVHSGLRPQCQFCDQTVSSMKNMATHMRAKHPEQYAEYVTKGN